MPDLTEKMTYDQTLDLVEEKLKQCVALLDPWCIDTKDHRFEYRARKHLNRTLWYLIEEKKERSALNARREAARRGTEKT